MAEEPGDSLNELFGSVARRLRHSSMKALAPWQITPSQARAISVVAHHGEIRPSDLAEHLRIAPRSVTEVVDSLEERGLVRRAADPDDRRASLITLTEAGEQVGVAAREARVAEAETIFGGLSVTDRRHLRRILAALAAQPESSTREG